VDSFSSYSSTTLYVYVSSLYENLDKKIEFNKRGSIFGTYFTLGA
jgi:hypothetical protein